MKLYTVTLVQPPGRNERKGWVHRYAVLAENEAAAVQRAKDYDPGSYRPGELWSAEVDEEGVVACGLYRAG